MPPEDYTPATTGALKLKGAKITKPKKKRPHPPPRPPSESKEQKTATAAQPPDDEDEGKGKNNRNGKDTAGDTAGDATPDTKAAEPPRPGKTDAELRHEEKRRRRLDERLKREGAKTHKERVEELNRYLSSLSEHHDMPRIGPG